MSDSRNTTQMRLKRLEARQFRKALKEGKTDILNQLFSSSIYVKLSRHGNNRHWIAKEKVQQRRIERRNLNKQALKEINVD